LAFNSKNIIYYINKYLHNLLSLYNLYLVLLIITYNSNNLFYYIPHKWIVLFPHADWLAQRWLAKYYLPPSSQRKTKWLPVSNKVSLKQVKVLFGPLVIQLVWSILKQLFTSVLVIVVDNCWIYNSFIPINYSDMYVIYETVHFYSVERLILVCLFRIVKPMFTHWQNA